MRNCPPPITSCSGWVEMIKEGRRDLLVVGTLLSIAFLLRVMRSEVCMYGDEWLSYWLWTKKILASEFVPKADFFSYVPPTLSYIAAVVTLLFDGSLHTIRLISVVFGSLSVPLMYFLGKEMYNWRVGLLSSVFLCFSAYHCLYSRVFMLDVPMLFFVIAFLYYFWLSQRPDNPKRMKHACVAGAMMGLAFDIKYLAIFLLPAALAYKLWVNRFNPRALLERDMLLMLAVAFLIFLPLLFCLLYTGVGLHGFKFYAVEKYEKERTMQRPIEFPLTDLLYRGWWRGWVVVFAWGMNALPPPLPSAFAISLTLLAFLSLAHHFILTVRGDEKSSFLILQVLTLSLIVIVCGNFPHYLLSLLPPFYIMFSQVILECRGLKPVIIPLAVVVLSLSMAIAVTSYYWDTGDYRPWLKDALRVVKMDMMRKGNEDHVVIGGAPMAEIYEYEMSEVGLNATVVHMLKRPGEYSRKLVSLNLEMIETLKPDYLIMDWDYYHYWFEDLREVFEDYKVLSLPTEAFPYPYYCYIFFRKEENEEALEEMSGRGERDWVSEDVFMRSVPAVMEVGRPYVILVPVKNVDNATEFVARLRVDKFRMFVENSSVTFFMNKGSARTLRFKVVPIVRYEGKLPVTFDLYAKLDDRYTKVASCTDYVHVVR